MKSMTLAAVAAASLALASCATASLREYAEAANELDPGCGKKVHAETEYLYIFGWPVPVPKASYDKVCNADQFVVLDDATKAAIRAEVSEALRAP